MDCLSHGISRCSGDSGNGHQCVWTISLAGSQGAPFTRATYSSSNLHLRRDPIRIRGRQLLTSSVNGCKHLGVAKYLEANDSPCAVMHSGTYSSRRRPLTSGRLRRRRRRLQEATKAATARNGRATGTRQEPGHVCIGGNGGLHTHGSSRLRAQRAVGMRYQGGAHIARMRVAMSEGKQECHTTGVPGVSRSWGAAAEGACMTLCVIPQLIYFKRKRKI